jgi:hypothetical protein
MLTVALRGESAQRLRALAAKDGLSLSKLLVRMMEVFEAQVASRNWLDTKSLGKKLATPLLGGILAAVSVPSFLCY